MSSDETGVAWITGGGSGIGRGIAYELSKRGWKVFLSGRRLAALEATAQDALGPGVCLAAPVDVTNEDELRAVVDRIKQDAGKIDCLVLSAGRNVASRSIEDTNPDEWRALVDTNATGVFLSLKAALPLLRAAEAPVVFSISSVAGLRALEMAGAGYVSSKFATRGLGSFAASELAREGIRVTTIYPGEVNTPILDERVSPPDEEARSRMVQPGDIGILVATILSFPQATHVPELVVKPLSQEIV